MHPEDDLFARLKAALARLDAEIDALAAKARQAGDEARTRYADDLERLKRRRVELEVRLDALRWAGEATFNSLARGLEEGAGLARKAFHDARAHFRQG
ncbi:hypothetical protein SAMN05192555_11143 [Franzmannia pantelleriensis]|uniref:Uncharacterized protein n=1 Tax=Franzmannia pantelleriensis TaxID=48727 RepID=A0A1G9RUR9_9GAMM|nr:hypothetical protein [Halomonas pantelleriensis]SDM26894.1 hypothetical protein SAMN05192555_11143 [Halomonas pantelleriensis]